MSKINEEKKERIPYLEMRLIWIKSELFAGRERLKNRDTLVKELFLKYGWDLSEYSEFSKYLFYR